MEAVLANLLLKVRDDEEVRQALHMSEQVISVAAVFFMTNKIPVGCMGSSHRDC